MNTKTRLANSWQSSLSDVAWRHDRCHRYRTMSYLQYGDGSLTLRVTVGIRGNEAKELLEDLQVEEQRISKVLLDVDSNAEGDELDGIDDDNLELVAQVISVLPQLRELHLLEKSGFNNGVFHEGYLMAQILPFFHHPTLQSLTVELDRRDMLDESTSLSIRRALKNFPSIQVLRIDKLSEGPAELLSRTLQQDEPIPDTSGVDRLLETVSQQQHIKDLTLGCWFVGEKPLASLLAATQLERLHLRCTGVVPHTSSDRVLEALASNTTLRTLELTPTGYLSFQETHVGNSSAFPCHSDNPHELSQVFVDSVARSCAGRPWTIIAARACPIRAIG